MAVPAVNIEIEQGADFTSTFTITNSDGSVFNMSSASAVAKAKKHPVWYTYVWFLATQPDTTFSSQKNFPLKSNKTKLFSF